jgi:drug/metabolite transporter (DMT)-like permease
MTTKAQEETNPIPILSTLGIAGILLGAVTIVASKRQIGDVWERRGGRLAQAYEQTTWAMRFSETIPLAMKNLTRKKGRTFLTFAGVAIAASMLASQALTVALSAQDAAGVSVEGYLYAVVAIALGVSFFAVGSTTFTAVHERRGEVGLMKAVASAVDG